MAPATPCPSPAEWQGYFLGRVADPWAGQLHDHLTTCPACQETARLVPADDDLVAAVRSQAGPAAGPGDPLVDRLIARLDALDPHVAGGHFPFLAPAEGPDELGRLGGYRVLKLLGAGGMGLVFEAEDPPLGRRIALKVMRPAVVADPAHRQRFIGEARAAAALRHDHIVTIHQVGEHDGTPFLAMELLPGESLADLLDRTGRLGVSAAVRLGRQVADGLGHAHAHGLIHRDVKPANIWLEAREDGSPRVKILDFGLARKAAGPDPEGADASGKPGGVGGVARGLTRADTLLGTPHYMAPEQAAGGPVDYRSDLFGLGCVLYRATTGRLPFDGPDARAVVGAVAADQPPPAHTLNPAVPPRLSALIGQLLAKHPGGRPDDARAVAAELAAIDTAGRRRRVGRRLGAGAVVGAALTVAALGLVGPGNAARYAAGQGRVTLEPGEPDLEVTLTRDGVTVATLGGGADRSLVLPAGDYDVALPPGLFDWRLADPRLDLGRGRDRLVRAEPDPGPDLPDGPPGELVRVPGYDGRHKCIHVLSHGRRVLSSDVTGGLQVWEAATGRRLARLPIDTRYLNAIAIAPDGRTVLVAEGAGVQVWDLVHLHNRATMPGTKAVTGVAFSPDGRRAVTATYEGEIRRWDVNTWSEIRPVLSVAGDGQMKGLWSVAYSPDGRRLLTAGGGRDQVRDWDADTGAPVLAYGGHTQGAWHAGYSPDGRLVLSAGSDGTALVWDADSGRRLHVLAGHKGEVRCAAFTPDGTRALTGGSDGTLRVWDVLTGRELARFRGHTGRVAAVAAAFGGRAAVTGSSDGTLLVWRLPSPE